MMIIVTVAACHLRQPVSKRAGELARLLIPHLHTFGLFTQRQRTHTETQLEASSSFIHLFIYFPIQATHLQIWYEFSKMSAGTTSKALALASIMLLHTWRQNVQYVSIKRAQLLLRLPRSSLIWQNTEEQEYVWIDGRKARQKTLIVSSTYSNLFGFVCLCNWVYWPCQLAETEQHEPQVEQSVAAANKRKKYPIYFMNPSGQQFEDCRLNSGGG